MCAGAMKGTFRRDIRMIVNHDYIQQCIIFTKLFFGLITLANIVYFLFNRVLHAFIHLNTPISDVLYVQVASSYCSLKTHTYDISTLLSHKPEYNKLRQI